MKKKEENFKGIYLKSLITILAVTLLVFNGCKTGEVRFDLDKTNDRVWLGADFWSVPLEDWKIENGRIECIGTLSNSRVNLLTYRLIGSGNLNVSFRFGMLEDGSTPGRTGIRLAMTDPTDTDNSYRSVCYFGQGIDVGVQTDGKLFINDQATDLPSGFDYSKMTMNIKAVSNEDEKELKVAVSDRNGLESELTSTHIDNLQGMIAFVNYFSQGSMNEMDVPKFWFDDIKMSGSMVEATPENAFGPILFSMYTLSKGIMKMSAQMPPLGVDDNKTVKLQLLKNSRWQDVFDFPVMNETIPIDFWQRARNNQDGYQLLLGRAGEDIYLGIFNWSDEAKTYDLAAFGAGPQTLEARHSKVLEYTGNLSFRELSKSLSHNLR